MIEICFFPEQLKLELHGHACYAPEGQDIVCAGISALYCALRSTPGVEEALEDWFGRQTRILRPERGERGRLESVFGTITRGMRDIARKYPGHAQYREALG